MYHNKAAIVNVAMNEAMRLMTNNSGVGGGNDEDGSGRLKGCLSPGTRYSYYATAAG